MIEHELPGRPTFLLVHGAWHNAAHWDRVAAALAAAGCRSVAIDLPGSGEGAALPVSYLAQDLAALATEPSPLAHLTLEDQAAAIVAEIRRQREHGPVVVVAHSAGGLAATAAVEQVPELVDRVVYVAAHCPVALPNMLGYLGLPENAGAQLGPAFLGDPAALGAVRINPRAADPAYQQALRQGFYNDLSPADARPFIAGLTPDLPLRVAADEVRVTPQRWGRVRRSFVRTLADQALPLALQDRMIAEADALTPQNRFEVHSLDSGHSPFASRPEPLAALLRVLS
ncbi:MAG: alpha/beta fold hydrolase [Xenophilus sp.]